MNGASDWRNWALVSLLGLIWGGSFTLTDIAVRELPPLTVAAWRLLIGAAALIPLAFWFGAGFPKSARVWAFALVSAAAANAMPFLLLTWAQTHVPSSLAGVFMASLPLILLPMAHAWVPGEQMTWPRAAGFFVGFCGVMTLFGVEALEALGGGAIETIAQLACLLAAAGYAIGSVVSKLAPPTHPLSFGGGDADSGGGDDAAGGPGGRRRQRPELQPGGGGGGAGVRPVSHGRGDGGAVGGASAGRAVISEPGELPSAALGDGVRRAAVGRDHFRAGASGAGVDPGRRGVVTIWATVWPDRVLRAQARRNPLTAFSDHT